jgi:hypothetical protein
MGIWSKRIFKKLIVHFGADRQNNRAKKQSVDQEKVCQKSALVIRREQGFTYNAADDAKQHN